MPSLRHGCDFMRAIGTFFGGAVSETTRELYVARSPVTYAARVTTPLLILHGAEDARVPTGQALASYRALRDAGATVELVVPSPLDTGAAPGLDLLLAVRDIQEIQSVRA